MPIDHNNPLAIKEASQSNRKPRLRHLAITAARPKRSTPLPAARRPSKP